MRIRPVTSADLAALTAIATAAKASWGYPPAWLEGWQDQLTVSPAQLERWIVSAAVSENTIVGFYALAPGVDHASLEHFWVSPHAMGQGVGRGLLAHARDRAAALGARSLLIDSDPHAEGFYLHLGAERIDTIPAPVATDSTRTLPRLRLRLGAD